MQKIEQALQRLAKITSSSNDQDLIIDASEELAELQQLLTDIEFVSFGKPCTRCCPDCGAEEGNRHKARCKLAKFIERAE